MENNSQEIEEWRSIEGYEELYEVSSLGRVRSCYRYVKDGRCTRLFRGRVLKLGMDRFGYIHVVLSKDNKQKMFLVHRLVAKAFQDICGQFREGLQVDHISTDRTDNRAVNLRWCTSKENQNNPLTKQHQKENTLKGEKHPMYGKLGKYNPNSIPIIQFDRQGNFIAEFESLMDAERKLGISEGNICMVLKGQRSHTHGFIFKYKTS